MNLKNGFIRLSVVLTFAVGIYGFFFNKTQVWDETYFTKLEADALKAKNNFFCEKLVIAMVTEVGTNKQIYYLGKDNGNRQTNFFDQFDKQDPVCDSLLTIAIQQKVKAPILVSEISNENIKSYVASYKSQSRTEYLKSQILGVFKAVAYLWLAFALVFTSFVSFRWVYKGFQR